MKGVLYYGSTSLGRRSVRFAILLTGFFGLLALEGGVSAVNAQSLSDALMAAYRNNPTLLARRARVRAQDEGVPQALSNWRPDVSFTASNSFSRVKNTRSTGTNINQTRHPLSLGIGITQPLFRGGRTLAATEGAENTIRSERALLMGSEQSVLLAGVTAYMDVFRDQSVLKLNINNEDVLKRQLEATRDRFQVGEITRTDVHQAEARLATAVADRIQAEGNLEAARAAYENVIGAPPSVELNAPDIQTTLPADKTEVLKLASSRNPNVVSAEFTRRAALDQADEVWGELLPSLDLVASWDRNHESAGEGGYTQTTEVGLSLTVPIYQQGAVYSRLREARQTAAEQALLIDQQRRDAVESATQAWEALLTAQARVKAFKTGIEANVVALEGVEKEASVGTRTVLDVLDAEQELLNSRVSHVRAQRDDVVAVYQVLEAIGRLTVRDLGFGDDAYDPRQHYREVRGKAFGGRSKGDHN